MKATTDSNEVFSGYNLNEDQYRYSVLMSVYIKEKAEFLDKSIDSMLKQTVMPSDFVLVCDGPLNDELYHVINSYKDNYPDLFQIVSLNENSGLGRALNYGLNFCKFEYVARMDSDDISCIDRVEKQLAMMHEMNYDVLSGTIMEFQKRPGDMQTKREVPLTQEHIRKFMARRNPFNHPCVMFCKSAVLQAGNYQPYYLLEDYYLWVRMVNAGANVGNLSDVLLYMRVGEGMYQRRIGWKYLKSFANLHWFIKKSGMCTTFDYISTIFALTIFTLLPRTVTQLIYTKMLRKSLE